MGWTRITIARTAVLYIATLLSLATIALAGHMHSSFLVKYDFQNLSIAVAALTIISTPVFLIVGSLRKGSFLTMNVVEVPVLGLLSILWLANASLSAEWDAILYGDIPCAKRLSVRGKMFCMEIPALEALSFITWICLFGYAAGTIVLCFIGKSRGNDVWLVAAADADYFTRKKNQNQGGSVVEPQVQYTGSTGQQLQMQMAYGQPQQVHFQQPMQEQMMYPAGTAQV